MEDEELSSMTDEREQESRQGMMPQGLSRRGLCLKIVVNTTTRVVVADVVGAVEVQYDEDPMEEVIWGHTRSNRETSGCRLPRGRRETRSTILMRP